MPTRFRYFDFLFTRVFLFFYSCFFRENDSQICVQGSYSLFNSFIHFIYLFIYFQIKHVHDVLLTAETCEGDNEEAEELTLPQIKLAMWVCIYIYIYIYTIQHNRFTNFNLMMAAQYTLECDCVIS